VIAYERNRTAVNDSMGNTNESMPQGSRPKITDTRETDIPSDNGSATS
jgi:hypothetical protein